MKKITLFGVTAAMLLSSATGALAAVETVQPNADGLYTVTADVAGVQKDAMYGVLAVQGNAALEEITEANITYIDQITATEAGKFSLANFGLKAGAEESTLYIGGAGLNGATEVAKLLLAGSTGVTINGNAISWNNANDAVYKIYASDVDVEDLVTDIKSESASLAAYTATKGEIAVIEGEDYDYERYTQAYAFEGVADGSYKLAIFKPGAYVMKLVDFTVADGNVAGLVDEYILWIKGDVDYTAEADFADLQTLFMHVSEVEELEGDALIVADTNEDEEVDFADLQRLFLHVSEAEPFED